MDKSIQAEGEVGIQIIPGGEYAVLVHKCPYEGVANTINWLYGIWLPKSGREVADANDFEIYRNSPHDTKPEDLITEIYLPLK